MSASVALTGIGYVGASGVGVEGLARDLAAGTLPLRAIEGNEEFRLPGCGSRAGLLEPGALSEWVAAAQARRMSPPSRMAVAAARMAVRDAGLEEQAVAGADTAVVLGTSYGCTTFTARLLAQMIDEGPQAISPFLFMETVANAHAGQIALAMGARGSSYTLCQREGSALAAVARARELLAAGRARRVLAGVVEEIGPLLFAILDRFGALSRTESVRPFDVRRDGFLPGEGATILVLEEEAAARARGARVRLRLRATARANDPTAPISDWGTGGAALGERLRERLIELDVDPQSIGRVVSGASGSRRGDRAEAQALRACFGARIPPILAPKSVTGEYGGGFLASAVLALEGIALAVQDFEPDPELGLAPSREVEHAPVSRLLVSSLSSGGPAFWLLLDRP